MKTHVFAHIISYLYFISGARILILLYSLNNMGDSVELLMTIIVIGAAAFILGPPALSGITNLLSNLNNAASGLGNNTANQNPSNNNDSSNNNNSNNSNNNQSNNAGNSSNSNNNQNISCVNGKCTGGGGGNNQQARKPFKLKPMP
jgi:hypothetical protein